jgi:hypothetical protein
LPGQFQSRKPFQLGELSGGRCDSLLQNRKIKVMSDTAENFDLTLSDIAFYLRTAESYGLGMEVIKEALLAMKNDPSLTVSEAMKMGYFEWVK